MATKTKTTITQKTTAAEKKQAAAKYVVSRIQLSSMVAANNVTEKKYPASITLDDIVIKKQIRENFDSGSIVELAANMEAQGQLQRILVNKMSNGRYELIAGERRVRAAKLNKWKSIDADVVEIDEKAASLAQLAENIQREDLSMIEKANGIAKIRDNLVSGRKATLEEIAAVVKKTSAWVSESLQLLDLPEVSRRAVDDGIVTDQTTANRIARIERLSGAEQAEKVLELLQEGGGKGRDIVTTALRDAKAIKSGASKPDKSKTISKASISAMKEPETSDDQQALAEALFGSVRMFSSLDDLTHLSASDSKQLSDWLKKHHSNGMKAKNRGIEVSSVIDGLADQEEGVFRGKSGLVALAAFMQGAHGETFSLKAVYQHMIKPK